MRAQVTFSFTVTAGLESHSTRVGACGPPCRIPHLSPFAAQPAPLDFQGTALCCGRTLGTRRRGDHAARPRLRGEDRAAPLRDEVRSVSDARPALVHLPR